MLILAVLAAVARAPFPWEGGGDRSVLQAVQAERCPTIFQPEQGGHLFHSERRGEQACCVLDRAVGAIEILHSIRKCRHYQQQTGTEDAADRSGLFELPAGVVSPCNADAASDLGNGVHMCCGKGGMLRANPSFNACFDAMHRAKDAAEHALGDLTSTFAQCVQRVDKAGKAGSAPVYTATCERAEDATVRYIKVLLGVARELYSGNAQRDLNPVARLFLDICSTSTLIPSSSSGSRHVGRGDDDDDASVASGGERRRLRLVLDQEELTYRCNSGSVAACKELAASRPLVSVPQYEVMPTLPPATGAAATSTKGPTRAPTEPATKRCSPGRFRADHLHCAVCPPGRAASQSTLPEGDNSDARCAYCGNGHFQPASGQIQCFACKGCPQNLHRHNCGGSSMGECHVCPMGRFAAGAAGAADPALVALAGQEWVNKNCAACQSCPAAHFRAGCGANTAGSCVPCPAGRFKEVAGTHDSRCTPCTAQCTGCGGSTRGRCRHSCPAGFFTNGRATQCSVCPSGQFSLTPNSVHCTDCAAGKFQPIAGKKSCFSCESCPAGKHRHGCSGDTRGHCHRCPLGRFLFVPRVGRKRCIKCHECPKGKFTHLCGGKHRGTCRACAAGKYLADVVTVISHRKLKGCKPCARCPPGRGDQLTGLRHECRGSWPGFCGAAPPSPPPPSKHASVARKVACPAGTYRAPHINVCVRCPAGKFAERSGQTSCEACPAGRYQDKVARAHCHVCRPCDGEYSGKSACGGTKPGVCHTWAPTPATTRAPTPAPTYELLCPFGHIIQTAHVDGAHPKCTPCPPGRFAIGDKDTKCTVCEAGQYQDQPARAHCKDCQDCKLPKARSLCGGKSPGRCVLCPQGQFVGRQPVCFSRGYHCHEIRACRHCLGCPVGQFAWACKGESTGKCQSCPAGKYRTELDEACQYCECPAGQILRGCDPVNGAACASSPPTASPTPIPTSRAPTQAPSPAPTPRADTCLEPILRFAEQHLGLVDDWAQ